MTPEQHKLISEALRDASIWLGLCANEFKDGGDSQRRRILQGKADRCNDALKVFLTSGTDAEGIQTKQL